MRPLRDNVRNKNIKARLKVESITERCRKARLRRFGHVKRWDHDYVGRKTLQMVPPGRRKRGRPKQRWMDSVNRDMRAIGTTKEEVHDRTGWRKIGDHMIRKDDKGNQPRGWDTIWQRTAQDRLTWRRHAEAFAQPRDTTAAQWWWWSYPSNARCHYFPGIG